MESTYFLIHLLRWCDYMKKIVLNIQDFFKGKEIETLTATITIGIFLISLGILLMGKEVLPYLGSRFVIFGSGLFYLSVILLVFIID